MLRCTPSGSGERLPLPVCMQGLSYVSRLTPLTHSEMGRPARAAVYKRRRAQPLTAERHRGSLGRTPCASGARSSSQVTHVPRPAVATMTSPIWMCGRLLLARLELLWRWMSSPAPAPGCLCTAPEQTLGVTQAERSALLQVRASPPLQLARRQSLMTPCRLRGAAASAQELAWTLQMPCQPTHHPQKVCTFPCVGQPLWSSWIYAVKPSFQWAPGLEPGEGAAGEDLCAVLWLSGQAAVDMEASSEDEVRA